MNVLSLFAGIGGLELGLERAGMTTVGQVEIDPFCRRVLAKHWPDVPRHDDVRTAADWWLSQERPTVDIICGGFPCQDISVAGARAGIIDGERSSLWSSLADTIRLLRPRYALVENVSALLVRGLDVVAADLAEIGYDLRWDCVPASAIGAPHRRDRWFGIAYPNRSQLWLEPIGELGSDGAAFAAVNGQDGHVADAAGERRRQGRPGRPACDGAYWSNVWPQALADSAGARYEAGPNRTADAASASRSLQSQRSGCSPRGHTAWTVEPDVGRVADGVPSRVDRLRALGNAVVPQVAEHIGRMIMQAERSSAAS